MSNQEDKNPTLLATPSVDGNGAATGDGGELDIAAQSVSAALRTSFLALKFVLLGLVVLYLGSGYFTVPPGSRAVTVQFGRIQGLDNQAGPVLEPGPHWTWPWPVSVNIIKVIEKPRTLDVSFWFDLPPQLRGRPLEELQNRAPEALAPGRDGYLLTGEQEIVHLQGIIKYRIDSLVDYARNVSDEAEPRDEDPGAQRLLHRVADWACTRTIAGMKTDAVIRGEGDTFRETVKRLMQKRLEDLHTGLTIVDIVVEKREVPLQVRAFYLQVVQKENEKLKVVSAARTAATQTLNEMAGPAHEPLKQAIQGYEMARATGDAPGAEAQMKQILALIDSAGGTVAGTIGQAMADRSRQELAVRAEVRRFRDLYDKYQANPSIFLAQLWADTRADILDSPELEVIYLPFGSKEIRMTLDHNPQYLKAREARRYQEQVNQGG